MQIIGKTGGDRRILFLGDSITADGRYLAYTEAYLWRAAPEARIRFVNLGVSSETVSGLSEPDHPWPRPCGLGRTSKALQEIRPDCVVFCYGMNDGIYYPLSEERFAAFREGVQRLLEMIRGCGAEAAILTPPPFDVSSIGGRALPEGAERFHFAAPYVKYNQVLRHYADWELGLASDSLQVIDLHTPLQAHIDRQRQVDDAFRWGDGIHPKADGHRLMAEILLSRLFGLDEIEWPDCLLDESSDWYALLLKRHTLLSGAWREHIGHDNPNKAQAKPLSEALGEGAELERLLRRQEV